MDIFNGESASDAGLFWGLTPLLLAMVFLAGCDARSEAQHAGEPPEVDVARV
ncbi:MAG TPA: efflux transporter periplasmic adaptor subunit, partial [Alcanivorax sp.]|nr:efflux transporter periplasmic adaptor subunit [Alcanivorax sp.]